MFYESPAYGYSEKSNSDMDVLHVKQGQLP